MDLKMMVTLWPSFSHFANFADDDRLAGIRLNSAMISNSELDQELEIIRTSKITVPLYFDVKGRQLRVTEVHKNPNYLDISLNHPIKVRTPTPVLFKAGEDHALLERVEEGGTRLIFRGGPAFNVGPGESLHIRHPSLEVGGPIFVPAELEKIAKVKQFGFTRYFLSYVEDQEDVDQFLELVGKDAEVCLKIENKRGLEFVANKFKKQPNLTLVTARGDLYVELERPHEILRATQLIVSKDSEACVGSRLLLSVINNSVPSCADFCELAWLYNIGYRNMMLCDGLCLDGSLLATAMNAFESFRNNYANDSDIV